MESQGRAILKGGGKMTETGYARILLDKKDTQIIELESEITKLRIEYERQIVKLQEENAELKKQVEQKQHLADVRLEQSLENYKLFSDERKARIDVDIALEDTTDKLTYAKTIIQDLLDNTDEYARQRAEDFLKENK